MAVNVNSGAAAADVGGFSVPEWVAFHEAIVPVVASYVDSSRDDLAERVTNSVFAVFRALLTDALGEPAASGRGVLPSREVVAGVVDPDAWNLSDEEYFEEYDDGMRGVGYCLELRNLRRRASLRRADSILELMPGKS